MSSVEPPSWDDLRVIEALERLGTAGRVARELGVSVSKVYRRIARLEETVGAPCIERGAGAGRLTDTGRALAAIGRQTQASIAGVTQRLRLAAADLDGEVRLTTVEGFIPLIAPTVQRLLDQNRRLRIDVEVGDRGPSVRRREVDLALTVIEPPEGLWGKRLFTITYGVYGTAGAVAVDPPRWIVLGPTSTTPQATWERANATPVVLRTNSLATTLRFVLAGLGVAILPRRLADLHPELVEAPAWGTALEPLDRPAWIVTHPDLRDVPHVRAVMDALSDLLR